MSMERVVLIRWLVWAYWLIGSLDVAAAMFLSDYLPDPLLAWQQAQAALNTGPASWLSGGWMILLLLGLIVGSLGVLQLRNWGRWLFAATNLLMFLSYPLLSAMVYTWFGGLFADLSLVLTGAILVLCFGPAASVLFVETDVPTKD